MELFKSARREVLFFYVSERHISLFKNKTIYKTKNTHDELCKCGGVQNKKYICGPLFLMRASDRKINLTWP